MKLDERGSTLVLALLVVLVFSVLGLSVLSSTVGETKRTVSTESNSQAQQYALDGLTYFETDFSNYINTTTPSSINLLEFLADYHDWFTVKTEDDSVKTQIKAQLKGLEDEYNIEVTSKGFADSTEKVITGYYMLKYQFDDDKVVFDIADFNAENTLEVNFAEDNTLLNVGLISELLELGLVESTGNSTDFFRVPENGALLDASLVADLVDLQLGDTGKFRVAEENRMIAIREGKLLGVGLNIELIDADINLLSYKEIEDTNILIDGGFIKGFLELEDEFEDRFEDKGCSGFFDCLGDTLGKVIGGVVDLVKLTVGELGDLLGGLLGPGGEWLGDAVKWLVDGVVRILDKEMDFNDIHFKKFAVIGNASIQQNNKDTDTQRIFTFDEGLYVSKSLVIGGEDDIKNIVDFNNSNQTPRNLEDYSHLMLRGDIVTMKNLLISDVSLRIGYSDKNEAHISPNDKFTNIYVHGDAEINNACITLKDNSYNFSVFVKGKLTIENNGNCTSFPGLYYAENEIEIITNNQEMTINGAVIGDVSIDYPEKLTINWDEQYLPKIKVKNIDLIPQGRLIE